MTAADELREAYALAINSAPKNAISTHEDLFRIVDAVLSVRDAELTQLREERDQLRGQVDAAEANLATARELLDYAWRLRAYGEHAPGGTETWAEWVARTEAFLRSLPAPSATHVRLHLGRGFETVREHVADCPVCRLRAALDTGGDPQP